MSKDIIQTGGAPAAIGPYSQAVRAGNTVYLSGQIGLDPATGNLREGIEAQARQVIANLQAVAEAAGGSLDDIVKITLLLADMGDFTTVNEIMARASRHPILRARRIRSPRCPRARASRSRACWSCSRRLRRPAGRAIALRRQQGSVDTRVAAKKPAARAESRQHDRGQARAHRHRARAGSGPASAAALRRPHAAVSPGSAGARQAWQVEGTVVNTEIQYRGRRQLVCLLEEGDAQLVLRFFHFYPSQQKSLAAGKRVRAFGEVRDGHFGLEMVHPPFMSSRRARRCPSA